MTTAEPKKGRSGEPPGYLDRPVQVKCWFCRAPNPRGTDTLGGATANGGTKIPVCATGEGCRDGRIFHGPMGDPHYPDQDCKICGPGEKQRAVQRNAGHLSAVARPGRSRRRPAS